VSLTDEVPQDRGYGARVAAIEPGGAEFIPLAERHGKSRQLLWTFSAPNMEFTTVGVGILGPLALGMSFWQTVLAIVIGTSLGAAAQAVLSSWGPGHGLPQMVISRSAFGFLGNILPAGFNTVLAGVGWFAVNSVSAALALHVLAPSLSTTVCLTLVLGVEVLVAFFGHNLVQAFERYVGVVLTVVFLVAAVWVLSDVKPGVSGHAIPGAFAIETAAVFGYAAGWNSFASDYSRYLAPGTSPRAVGGYAAAGILMSCVPLMIAGAAVITAGQETFDPSAFTNLLPTWYGKVVLVAVVVGSVSANAMNLYSGAISFTSLGIKLPSRVSRAVVGLVLGVVGAVASYQGLHDAAAAYNNFLLVVAYALGPWLGIVLVDRFLRRGHDFQNLLTDSKYVNWSGPISYVAACFLSVWLFSNQHNYTGPVPRHFESAGDLTPLVGFVVGGLLYRALVAVWKPALSTAEFESRGRSMTPERVTTAGELA
jgi:purine-cytosine permease-like protein